MYKQEALNLVWPGVGKKHNALAADELRQAN
jgi:hypothetical protein